MANEEKGRCETTLFSNKKTFYDMLGGKKKEL